MKTIELFCTGCNKLVLKELKEVTRQRKNGNYNFYCNSKCFGMSHTKTIRHEYRFCDYCQTIFLTDYTTETMHCSRGCASANSVTNYRREKAKEVGINNLAKGREIKAVANSLRKREMWKYVEISKLLNEKNIFHEFEFPLINFIFDLALFEQKILIEFDGNYHDQSQQKTIDYEKIKTAFTFGWNVKRIKTPNNEILSSDLILHLI